MKVSREIAEEVWMYAGPRPFTLNAEDHPLVGKSGAKLRDRRCLRRGVRNRRLIAEKTIEGVEYSLHATKGWRRRRT